MSGGSLRLPHRLFALLLAFAACGLTSQATLAQYREESDVVGKVSIRTWQRWPQSASRGWMPIYVELNNGSGREERVQVSASSGNFSSGGVSTAVVLAPGESRRVELVVPLIGGYDWRSSFAYTVRVAAAGETSRQYNFGAIGSSINGSRPVMVFGPELPKAGLPESWTASLSTLVLEDLDPWSGMHLGGPATHVQPEATEVTTGGNNVPLVAGTFDEMPQRMDAYSSLSGVVLTHPRRIEAGKNLEDLFAWTRVGGYLTLCGDGAEEFVRQRPELASWTKERFRITEDEAFSAYQCGYGRLIVAEGVTMEDPSLRSGLREALRNWRGFLPDRNYAQLPSRSIPGVDDPPYLVFGFFLLLFALLIGPVNFVWVKKTKRPVLLLFTIPLISAAATFLLLGYGILAQGIDTKQSSTVLALLDQRANRVELGQQSSIYVGFARKRGLAPGPRTVVAPVLHSAMGNDMVNNWSVREGAQRFLSGSYMPVREVGSHVVLSERSTRFGLEVSRNGASLSATNGFDTAVSELALCDSDGSFWLAEGPVDPGQTVTLTATDQEAWREKRLDWLREFGPDSLPASYRVLPDSYRLQLSEGSFEDDLGLEANLSGGVHGVIGILEEGATR